METIKPRSWNGFKRTISEIRKSYESYNIKLGNGEVYKKQIKILFRGQADTNWKLNTTLERRTNQKLTILQYSVHADYCVNEIESFTGKTWNVSQFPEFQKEIEETHDRFSIVPPIV